MKICAHNPVNAEFSLCGVAFDAAETENEVDAKYVLATEAGESVSCGDCKLVINEIYSTYTQTGRLK